VSSDATTARPEGFAFLRKNTEVIIAILLGIVSIGTAYASFESSLYGGTQAQAYTNGTTQSTEAESLYLENNQTFVQNSQLWQTLTELRLDIANPDPAIADAAQIKYDTIYFQSVSEDFDKAIQWADEKNASEPDLYYSPLDNEDYQASLFGPYADTKDEADATIAAGDRANGLSDRLTLNTVLMAISLFLLGIAAVVRQYRVQLILGTVAVVIFLTAVVLTSLIPALPFTFV
jgi:hypothetical protein